MSEWPSNFPYYREEPQSHPLAEHWIKDFLNMALPTRARLSFPHSQSLPSGSLHKPLILIHHKADRMSKNFNPMASKMKTTITEK